MSESDDFLPDERLEKLSPDTAQILNKARPRRLRKNVVVGIIAVLCGVLMLALVFGITQNPLVPDAGVVLMPAIAGEDNVPGFVKTGPQSYADVPEPEPQIVQLGPAMQGDLAAAGVPAPADSPFEDLAPQGQTEEEKRLAQEWLEVLNGPVALNVNLDFGDDTTETDPQPQATPQADLATTLLSGLQTTPAGNGGGAGHQQRKLDFLENSPSADSNFYVQGRLQAPFSPYELKAGAVIPCTLITGINSDLPGDITCSVRQNVFDTVTGNHLLVPQGTRVIGEYDSQVIFGQSRVLVIWHRIIMPNGGSLDLEGMPGVDMAGNSGYVDRVNNHWGRLAGAVVLSSLFAAAPVAAAGNDTGFNRDIESEIARSIGANTRDAGDQIVERELTVQPTITVRPGYAINVFVQKDLILSPYKVHTTYEIGIDPTANTN